MDSIELSKPAIKENLQHTRYEYKKCELPRNFESDSLKLRELIDLSSNPILDAQSRSSILSQCSRVLESHITQCMELSYRIHLEVASCNYVVSPNGSQKHDLNTDSSVHSVNKIKPVLSTPNVVHGKDGSYKKLPKKIDIL